MSNSVILEHQVQDPRVLLDWRLGPLLRKAVFEHFVPKKCARQSNYSRGLGGTHFLRVSIVPLGARHAWAVRGNAALWNVARAPGLLERR